MISCVALTSAKMSVEAAEPVRTASSPLSGSRHFGKKKKAGVSQSCLGSGLFLPTSRNFGIIVSVIVAETFTRVLEIDHKIITAIKSLFFCLCLNSNLKNKRNSSEMLQAHLQPSTRRAIMRFLKNKKVKKKEKFVTGDSSQAASVCIYSRAASIV